MVLSIGMSLCREGKSAGQEFGAEEEPRWFREVRYGWRQAKDRGTGVRHRGSSFHDHRRVGAWFVTTGSISNAQPTTGIQREYRSIEIAASASSWLMRQ